jgi:hypothetical protein
MQCMQQAPCSTQHAEHKRSPNHIAFGASAQADEPPAPHAQRCAATHADRRSSAFVPLCAGSAGSGGSGRRSRCLGFSACRGRPRSRSRKSACSRASNAMRYGADASRPEGLVPWSTVE